MSANERAELLLRVLCDVVPPEADAAYLFAQTEPNQQSVFQAARSLLHRKAVGRIWISDCTTKSGYIGATACREAMVRAGVPDEVIEEVPTEPTDILHTKIEAQAIVRFATIRGCRRLIVTSAPFHQERAFMAAVTAAMHDDPDLMIYSVPGRAQPWDEVVTHSQGTLRGTRAELIESERQRIETYAAQGDLACRADVLAYLRRRDDRKRRR
ncbi:YdcF family protein [Anaerobaca lacustris]|uniref:DUF218 domain-containing protein n=1 Tax=Anaerobaca lacustris TaxID=3044600 RepID=A0AAW6TZK5_9BACT|nr:hypothetical protein [Sedimentisphaerales bacterium M17dextr]